MKELALKLMLTPSDGNERDALCNRAICTAHVKQQYGLPVDFDVVNPNTHR